MTQRAFARRLTATPKALPVFSLLFCAAHSHFLCTSRRAAGLRTVRAAGAAPNVVIDVRLMAINVINLNKKQYGKTTTTTLAQCKLIARNGKSTKPTADCVRLCCICFVRFFWYFFGVFKCCLYYLLLPFGNSCLKMTIGRPSRSWCAHTGRNVPTDIGEHQLVLFNVICRP